MIEKGRNFLGSVSNMEDRLDERLKLLGLSLGVGTALIMFPKLREPIIDALASGVRRHGDLDFSGRIPMWFTRFLPKEERQEAANMMKVAKYNHLSEKGDNKNV